MGDEVETSDPVAKIVATGQKSEAAIVCGATDRGLLWQIL